MPGSQSVKIGLLSELLNATVAQVNPVSRTVTIPAVSVTTASTVTSVLTQPGPLSRTVTIPAVSVPSGARKLGGTNDYNTAGTSPPPFPRPPPLALPAGTAVPAGTAASLQAAINAA